MAAIRSSCCNPSPATTSFCQANNKRSSDLRSAGMPHEKDPSQEPATETRFDELCETAATGTGARRLALPGLREHAAITGASPQIPQPFGQRYRTELDHSLRSMPRAHPL